MNSNPSSMPESVTGVISKLSSKIKNNFLIIFLGLGMLCFFTAVAACLIWAAKNTIVKYYKSSDGNSAYNGTNSKQNNNIITRGYIGDKRNDNEVYNKNDNDTSSNDMSSMSDYETFNKRVEYLKNEYKVYNDNVTSVSTKRKTTPQDIVDTTLFLQNHDNYKKV